MRELFVYCDESVFSGRYYSNFYGGILIESHHIEEVNGRLETKKQSLNLFGEIKWQKISAPYANKYVEFLDEVFDLLEEKKLKIRIMFRQNNYTAIGLTPEQRENEYFRLYYQFIKHAFGLRFANRTRQTVAVRLHFDRLPDTKEKAATFKGHLLGLNSSSFFHSTGVRISPDQMAEIDSKEHVALQALDIVLGAIQFRLNNMHLEKPEGARVRGNRTIAKESVYKHILSRIRRMRPNFNVGINTSDHNDPTSRWDDAYRHWAFVPKDREPNLNYKNKKAPRSLQRVSSKT
jgi:Protein of unknown function (DUF3800)